VLQELATETGKSAWAVASMLFFIAVWVVVATKVWRTPPEELAEFARMPLSDDAGNGAELPRGESPRG
jgi:hypothetical protein